MSAGEKNDILYLANLTKETDMKQFNMFDAKTNLSKIAKMLEEGTEDYVIIARNGKPLLRITLEKQKQASERFGIAKGMFSVPENFDEIDISEDFEGDLF